MLITPPLNRTPMAPGVWPPPAGLLVRQTRGGDAWQYAGAFRRVLLLVLTVAQTCVGAYFMSSVLPYHGGELLEVAVLGVFAVLFWWLSAGFWTAVLGFYVLLRGDRFSISRSVGSDQAIPAEARTALVVPICNEDVQRVFAGLRATWQSLERAGGRAHFDLYVL